MGKTPWCHMHTRVCGRSAIWALALFLSLAFALYQMVRRLPKKSPLEAVVTTTNAQTETVSDQGFLQLPEKSSLEAARTTKSTKKAQTEKPTTTNYSISGEIPAKQSLRAARIMLVTHFNNEEFLLPYWIKHHANMVDTAILIDYASSDDSVNIIKQLAPASWKVVQSTTGDVFGAIDCDEQVLRWENEHPNDWVIALTITEFLVHPNLKRMLREVQPKDASGVVLRFPALVIAGDDKEPLERNISLLRQRSAYMIPEGHQAYGLWGHYSRILHLNTAKTYKYSPGRHGLCLVTSKHKHCTPSVAIPAASEGFIMKFMWTPWPEVVLRKLNVGKHVPKSDVVLSFGFQHTAATSEQKLMQSRNQALHNRLLFDLKSDQAGADDLKPYHK